MQRYVRAEKYGRASEIIASLWLQCQGYRIVSRRFKSPYGEIDLIVRKGSMVAMVEVKYRQSLEEGLFAVTPFQQERIARTASAYLSRRKIAYEWLRFDVMVVRPWKLPYHLKDAWRQQA